MLRKLLLWLSENQTLRRQLPRYRFFRNAVSRFMPGEELEDALREAARLQARGIKTVLTLLGENVTDAAEAARVTRHYTDALTEICRRNLNSELSVKLTQLGLDSRRETAFDNLQSIVRHAKSLDGGVVWIDMEASRYLEATLNLFRRTREVHDNVGLCLQAYLYRTGKDLDGLLPQTCSVRLVKGAYAEPREIAFPKKAEVDTNFFTLALRLLENDCRDGHNRPALATHDWDLIRRIQKAAESRGIDRSAYEFQMLYGIRLDLQEQLVKEGYRLRVLISYGREWYPWYVRRLAERPANLWFVVKNVFRP